MLERSFNQRGGAIIGMYFNIAFVVPEGGLLSSVK